MFAFVTEAGRPRRAKSLFFPCCNSSLPLSAAQAYLRLQSLDDDTKQAALALKQTMLDSDFAVHAYRCRPAGLEQHSTAQHSTARKHSYYCFKIVLLS